MTIISPEAARRRSLCDRLEAAFMQEIALLKASPPFYTRSTRTCSGTQMQHHSVSSSEQI